MLKEEVSGAAEQTFTKLENLMVENILGSQSFKFIFLYASPRVRELHLTLRGKANEADKNLNIAQIGSECLLSHQLLLKNKGVQTCGIYSILRDESQPLRMADANTVFLETKDLEADVTGKLAALGHFLRT
jgi:hypothetical protein